MTTSAIRLRWETSLMKHKIKKDTSQISDPKSRIESQTMSEKKENKASRM